MWYDDNRVSVAGIEIVAPKINCCPQCNHPVDDHDDYACNWRMNWEGTWQPDIAFDSTSWGE